MALVLGDDFEFVLGTFHWNRSPTILLMIVPIPTALIPCFIDHLFLVSDFRLLPCRDFLHFSYSLSTAAFASGINSAWDERYFAHALGFPRLASLRDRTSRIF